MLIICAIFYYITLHYLEWPKYKTAKLLLYTVHTSEKSLNEMLS